MITNHVFPQRAKIKKSFESNWHWRFDQGQGYEKKECRLKSQAKQLHIFKLSKTRSRINNDFSRIFLIY